MLLFLYIPVAYTYHQIPKNIKFKDYKTSDLDDLNPEMNIRKLNDDRNT